MVVEVDECPPAEQPVNLVLARGVALHQPLESAGLVAAVVVNVHLWIPGVARDNKIDEGLEGCLLAGPVVRPDRVVDRLAADDFDPAEEILEAVVERPRVGLDVEEDVQRRGLR